jgi:glycosyltransferase involved in cell wall biosynthesis
LPKKRYREDKVTFDICFVAKQYSEKGKDKGYDLFIEVAKQIIERTDDIYFHVVGNFDETDIDISGFEGRIIFYGLREPEFLRQFYCGMDIFLSPNRPFRLYEGNFDGFPLGGDAGYCGVARFVADELNMNEHYKNGEEIVIIDLQSEHITAKIMEYYEHPTRLYELALAGQKKAQMLLDRDSQVERRLDIFNNYVEVKR